MRHSLKAILFAVLTAVTTTAQAYYELHIFINPDKTAYIESVGTDAVRWDGYQLYSDTNGLDPVGWYSFADWVADNPMEVTALYGVEALGMAELPIINEGHLGELNGTGMFDLPPGARIQLGRPFKDPFAAGVDAYGTYHTPAGNAPLLWVPEPSSFALGVFGLAALLALRWLQRRTA